MLKPPSLQKEFSLVYSEDPALDLPAVPPLADDASEDERARHKAIVDERQAKLRVARETGRWNEACRPDMQPTVFLFAPLTGSALTWLQGESGRENLTTDESIELAFRLTLRSVANLNKFEVKTEHHESGRRLVSRDTLDALYAIGGDAEPLLGRRVVLELGAVVLARAVEGLSPP